MKDTASSYVNITYYSSCLTNGPAYATSKCDNVTLGDVVYFTAEILLTACPPDPKDWHPTIQIYPVGIDERLTVNLEMLCSCDCEKKGSNGYEEFSPKCNGTGTLMCGVCECDSMHVGKHCECSIDDMNQKSQKGCIPPNSTDTRVCNGLGNCECGQCKCFPRADPEEIIQGEFCQCNNFSCERTGGKICSGNGYCECGVCKCNENWIGDSCQCLNTVDSCKAPGSDRICSGRGECHCGKCVCATNGTERYYGNYCERCPECTKRCDDLKDCVQCQMFGTGPLKDSCMSNCTTFTPKPVAVVEVLQDEIKCSFYDEDDCKFVFKYTEVNGVLEVTAQEVPDCPHKVFMLGIVLGVVAAIVLIGLAILLLWKLLTTIHDRREFARFEKERMNAKWDTGENPIYKQATSTFKNPMYAGK